MNPVQDTSSDQFFTPLRCVPPHRGIKGRVEARLSSP